MQLTRFSGLQLLREGRLYLLKSVGAAEGEGPVHTDGNVLSRTPEDGRRRESIRIWGELHQILDQLCGTPLVCLHQGIFNCEAFTDTPFTPPLLSAVEHPSCSPLPLPQPQPVTSSITH